MFKTIGSYVLAGAVALCGADAAYAQQQSPAFRVGQTKAPQTLNFTFGAFVPRGADGRVEGDVLTFNQTFLTFDIGDFTGVTFGGEYLLRYRLHPECERASIADAIRSYLHGANKPPGAHHDPAA